MKKIIEIPQLREDMKSAVFCAWLIEEGEPYKKGEPVYEIETDKVVNQIEAPEDGILLKQIAEEGDRIPVFSAVAEVEV